jgi:hypothetical protein
MTVLNAMMIAVALSAPQTQTPTHWDAEDRRIVGSVISPCLNKILSNESSARWATGWTLDPSMNFRVRPRSDNTVYSASMNIGTSFDTRLRCSVTVPAGDLSGAIAQLDAMTVEEFTSRREGNDWGFYRRPSNIRPVFTLTARANPNGSVSISIATDGM